MNRTALVVTVLTLAVVACSDDDAAEPLSMESAVAAAEVAVGTDAQTADAEVDGECAVVTFPNESPVILKARDGKWEVVSMGPDGPAYNPDSPDCA